MSEQYKTEKPVTSFGPRPGRGLGRGPLGHMGLGMPVEKAKNFKGTLKRLVKYLLPYKIQLIVVLAMAVLSTVFAIAGPKILGQATTKLFEGLMTIIRKMPNAGIDFAVIAQILLFLTGLYLVSAVFSYIQQYIMAGISQKTVYNMRRDISIKLSRLPLKFFDSKTHGEILSRVTNDVDNISTTLQQALTQLITSLVTIAGVLVMMLTISPLLTLIGIITLPVSIIFTRLITLQSRKFFAGQQKAIGALSGHVEEMYTGHKIIKAYGREQESITAFNQVNEELYHYGWKAQFISGIIMPLMNFIGNIGYVAVCVVGGIMVTKRTIEIGDIQAFIQYLRQFTMPIIQTANIANVIQSTIASAERVFELLDETEQIPDKVDAEQLPAIKGAVRFNDVRFSYKPEVQLIENMNIDVQPGHVIAIVGPTGAGKTTLVNLLMRFYEIDAGKIMVDGMDIVNMKRGSLRSIFGMVLQDTWLFNGTIRDNIAYGRGNATEADIIQAARAAHADHFIRTLPEGYNTILNEEASNISQGQKQLLTIARAILANPAILILDEATSNVDTRTELYIQRGMLELMKARTSFVIAHRLSTIRHAHLILVMNEGRLIEQGTHKELLAKNGFYADLYNSQFIKTVHD